MFRRMIYLADYVQGRIDRRRSRKQLLELDDRLLSDIGITRVRAQQEAKSDFWR